LEAGMVVWDKGHVTIDALGLQAEPRADGATAVQVISRDEG